MTKFGDIISNTDTITFTDIGSGFYSLVVRAKNISSAGGFYSISFGETAYKSDIPSGFYGINVKQSDNLAKFKNINTLAFNTSSFYLKQNSPNTDEVMVNFRGTAGGGGSGEANTISSAGGTETLVATPSKVGVDLQTKGLTAGTGISLSSDSSSVTITNTNTGTTRIKLTADEAGKTDATLVDTGLSFSVTSGTYYRFIFAVQYTSTVSTVGIKLGLTFPNVTQFSSGLLIWGVATSGGNVNPFPGAIVSSGGSVSSATTVDTSNYYATVEGLILPSANGTLMLQYAAETTGATVTLKQGSVAILESY